MARLEGKLIFLKDPQSTFGGSLPTTREALVVHDTVKDTVEFRIDKRLVCITTWDESKALFVAWRKVPYDLYKILAKERDNNDGEQ